ncbi:DUF4878 domain-containing protein [Haematomicrobium sanguinis]|uniref:DUF4878 domain-containing protein n=1 Tax=Haematomicrobium sanguinis TaxID=479106 RepID=UPI00047AB37D|nr:DUF4878 domain-containing protein [Haematomicrobium sanguinis]
MQSSALIKVVAAWLLALMVLIAGFVLTVVVLNSNVFAPEQQVKDYIKALQEGDGARALGLLNANVPQGDAAMLSGAGLIEATKGISNITVSDAQPAGPDRSKVEVSYEVDGKQKTTEFALEKSGTQWGFFNTWRFVETTLPTVDVRVVNENDVVVNGVRMNAPEGVTHFPVFYPAVYTAEFSSKFFEGEPRNVAVTSRQDSKLSINITPAPTQALTDAVSQKINAYLDECATQQVLAPSNCPFQASVERIKNGAPIKWTIDTYPTVTIEPANGGWAIKPLSGTARLTTMSIDLFTGAEVPVDQEVPFGFDATMNITDTEVSVTPVINFAR